MTSAVNASGNPDIDGLLWGWKYDGTSFTYSFSTSSAEYTNYGYAGVIGLQAFNATQQAAVIAGFDLVASYTGLTFTEVAPGGAPARFRFAEASQLNYTNDPNVAAYTGWHAPGGGTAEGAPPELAYNGSAPTTPLYAQGDAWFNTTTYNDPLWGTFALQAGIWHEMGHTLGLKHGHNAQSGHGTLFPALPADHNSYEYSIMTYHQYVGDNNAGDNAPHHALSFMINDIAALQYIYGANFNTNSGSTTYRWDTNGGYYINGVFQNQPATGTYIFQSIWDGNGVDTYDFSAFGTNQTINLAPGAYSTIPGMLADLGDGHFARGNVYNAYLYNNDLRSYIENVYTGSGNDTIYGNGVNNTIVSGDGNDTIYGYGGTDLIVGEGGNDTIYGGDSTDYIDGRHGGDFLAGQNGDDVIFGDGYTTTYGFGSDLIYGGEGNDILMGESGDHITTLGAADTIFGGNGVDTIFGGAGDDTLYGEGGNDVMDGGFGNDVMIGGAGSETMLGSGNSAYKAASAGGDRFVYQALSDGGDMIYGFDFDLATGRDTIDFRTLFDSIGYAGNTPRADGFLYIFQNGANIDVYVDSNGPAGGVNLTRMLSLMDANAPGSSLSDSFFLFQ